MQRTILCTLILLFTSLPSSFAGDLPATFNVAGSPLSLNGSGQRTKVFIKLYNAGLYLPSPSKDATRIIQTDGPMAIKLKITSDLITAEKMEKATLKGFKHSTGGQLAPIAGDIDEFMAVFRQGIKTGDTYDLAYTPDTGTVVSKNGATQISIEGLAFKQALFGIWLGEKPAQNKLKKAMLGGQ